MLSGTKIIGFFLRDENDCLFGTSEVFFKSLDSGLCYKEDTLFSSLYLETKLTPSERARLFYYNHRYIVKRAAPFLITKYGEVVYD